MTRYRLRRPGRASSRVDRAPNPNENEQEEDEDQVEEGEEQDQETEDEEDEEFEEESPWTLPLVLGKDNPLKHLTQAQRDLALDTLEIETMDRVQKLRASLDVLTTSLKFRTEAEIKRLPAEVRAMSVEEFWFKYNGSAKEYLRRQKENKIDPNMMLVQGISDIKRLHRLGKRI
ncbi:hypothetical protein BGZ83_000639 [Gryganskiella cystojenkinii]|nr:hypothetical protein BGZ83_000639 [Gryganskiella cystojenkinii]